MVTIVLYRPEKPANVGNIIRTCMAFSMNLCIIGELSFSLSDKAFKRAEMDYCIGFDIERYDTIQEFLLKHKEDEGYFVTRYSNKVYSSFDLKEKNKNFFFMFGRESNGLPKELLKENVDRAMRIPMMPNCRSLNLSNTVAIVASEFLRQNSFLSLSTKECIKGEDFLLKD